MQRGPVSTTCSDVGRRTFLKCGGGLAAASFAAPALEAFGAESVRGKSPAKSCILIYLLGGPPHLDMWDLKPEAPAEIRGPFQPIATRTPGLMICEHLPQLAAMSERWSLVRSVSHENHNHTPMIYYTLTGRQVAQPSVDNDVRPPQRADFPHLGAIVARMKPTPAGLPGFVAIPELAVRSSTEGEFKRARSLLRGGGAGFLGARLDPLPVNGDPGTAEAIPALTAPADVPEQRLESRAALLAALESSARHIERAAPYAQLRDQAVFLAGATGGGSKLYTLDGESDALRERYGRHRFGRALLLARRLTEAGTPMVAVHFNEMTKCDGWDTHSKNFPALKDELLPMVDQSLSALLEDLANRDRLDETLVFVMGEFGRTPKINANGGRDHWGSCQSVLLAGGGLKAGQVIGASDKIGAWPVTEKIDPIDIHATVLSRLGCPPEMLMTDRLNRPFHLSDGQVIEALL